MALQFTSEQLEFRDSIKAAFTAGLGSKLRQAIIQQTQVDLTGFYQQISNLALKDYFLTQPATKNSDLILIAIEVGKSLLPDRLYPALILIDLVQDLSEVDFINLTEINLVEKSKKIATSQNCKKLYLAVNDLLYKFENFKTNKLISLDHTYLYQAVDLSSAKQTVVEIKDLKERINLLDLCKVAEILGACEQALNLTTEYVKTRKQFSVPVGGFQAIQHKLADAYLMFEALRSLLMFAVDALTNNKTDLGLSLAALINLVHDDAPKIIETCIQVHGGIGFTWEYPLHWYFKRVLALLTFINKARLEDKLLELVN